MPRACSLWMCFVATDSSFRARQPLQYEGWAQYATEGLACTGLSEGLSEGLTCNG